MHIYSVPLPHSIQLQANCWRLNVCPGLGRIAGNTLSLKSSCNGAAAGASSTSFILFTAELPFQPGTKCALQLGVLFKDVAKHVLTTITEVSEAEKCVILAGLCSDSARDSYWQ